MSRPHGRGSAGRSAYEVFKTRRRQKLRREWRDAAIIVAVIVGCVAAMVAFDGAIALLAAGLLGAFASMAVVFWVIGDVHALPYAWGSVGEQRTADQLADLDSSWHVEHDVEHPYGNWDHVVIGPGGVFLVETKQLSRIATVTGDALVAGRLRFSGRGLRRSAIDLKQRLGVGWVQAVVAVWADFPQRCVEQERVVYVDGSSLVEWLRTQPVRLAAPARAAAAAALASLEPVGRDPQPESKLR